jgi:hypothetical protein
MREIIGELIFESSLPDTLPSSTSTRRISSLDHEITDHAVKYDAIIITTLRETHKVLDRFRRILRIEFECDISEVRRERDLRIGHRIVVRFLPMQE